MEEFYEVSCSGAKSHVINSLCICTHRSGVSEMFASTFYLQPTDESKSLFRSFFSALT